MAKHSRAPVVLVATSGTAGAHFYPAVIEAAMAQVPLVVLTADRPLELQGWGAPQTVPQARFFGDFARLYADVGLPEANDAALVHLRATVARAVAMASRAPRGAVQLNVPFREPLAPTPEPFAAEQLSALARDGRGGGCRSPASPRRRASRIPGRWRRFAPGWRPPSGASSSAGLGTRTTASRRPSPRSPRPPATRCWPRPPRRRAMAAARPRCPSMTRCCATSPSRRRTGRSWCCASAGA